MDELRRFKNVLTRNEIEFEEKNLPLKDVKTGEVWVENAPAVEFTFDGETHQIAFDKQSDCYVHFKPAPTGWHEYGLYELKELIEDEGY